MLERAFGAIVCAIVSFSGIRRGPVVRAIIGVVLLAGGGVMIWKGWKLSAPAASVEEAGTDREKLAEDMLPLVNNEARENHKALLYAQNRVHEVFQRYRNRAPHFADELARWGVKWKLMKSALHDWWNKDNESAKVAQSAFSKSVFSEAELKRDLEEVMHEFLGEMEASRNRMLLHAHESVSQSHLPLASLSAEEFSSEFNARTKSVVAARAKEMPQLTLLSATGGMAASIGAGYLAETVAGLLVRWAATAATTAGGSTVGGAVAGGGGGSAVGPWGTVIGVTAGLVVGGVVDWAMESRFKEKVTRQTVEILDGMENAALNDRKKGLYAMLEQIVDENRAAHTEAMRALVEKVAIP